MVAVVQQTWLGIVSALVPSVIALAAAIVGYLNHRQLKTNNGKTIASLVEDVHGAASVAAIPFAPDVPIVVAVPVPPEPKP